MDIVIIFPSSPGSFAELGMFCLPKVVAQKMCIVINARYKKKRASFLRLGPVKAAQQNNAQVVYVDYRKRNHVWEKVKEAVLQVKASKRRQRLLAP
jgi:hypothetical protein